MVHSGCEDRSKIGVEVQLDILGVLQRFLSQWPCCKAIMSIKPPEKLCSFHQGRRDCVPFPSHGQGSGLPLVSH